MQQPANITFINNMLLCDNQDRERLVLVQLESMRQNEVCVSETASGKKLSVILFAGNESFDDFDEEIISKDGVVCPNVYTLLLEQVTRLFCITLLG